MGHQRVTALLVLSAAILLGAASPQRGGGPPPVAPSAELTGTGFVVGQVVDAATNRPIPGAVVVTNIRTAVTNGGGRGAGPAGGPPPTLPVRLVTGADGRFVFRDLPKISLVITASADGYVSATTGQARPGALSVSVDVGEGEHLTDVRIQLWKAAVVTGTVTDEAGDPVVSLPIRAAHRTAVAGRVRYTIGNVGTTDDRGVFRISALPPGDYVVFAPQTQSTVPTATLDAMMQAVGSGTPAGAAMMDLFGGAIGPVRMTGLRVDDLMVTSPSGSAVVTAEGRVLTNQTVYYPSATTLAQATVLTLKSGEVRSGVDLQMRLVPTARISGTVVAGGAPAGAVPVRLVSNSPDDAPGADAVDVATTTTRGDGTFTFLGVPPGQFLATAVRRPRPQIPAELASNPMVQMAFGGGGGPNEALYGSATVGTDGRDVSDLVITMTPGAVVSGRFVFEGTAAQPPPQQLRSLSVTLQSADGRSAGQPISPGPAQRSPADVANGDFKTAAYPAGRYLLNASNPSGSWMVKSILAGGRNVLRDPLELKDDEVTGVVVTFTDKIAQVTGAVKMPGGAVLRPGAVVFVFPADYPERIAVADARLFRNGGVTKTGTYTMGGLPPGDYFVAVIAPEDVPDSRDMPFFSALSRVATHVTLTEGELKTLDLQPVRVVR